MGAPEFAHIFAKLHEGPRDECQARIKSLANLIAKDHYNYSHREKDEVTASMGVGVYLTKTSDEMWGPARLLEVGNETTGTRTFKVKHHASLEQALSWKIVRWLKG